MPQRRGEAQGAGSVHPAEHLYPGSRQVASGRGTADKPRPGRAWPPPDKILSRLRQLRCSLLALKKFSPCEAINGNRKAEIAKPVGRCSCRGAEMDFLDCGKAAKINLPAGKFPSRLS